MDKEDIVDNLKNLYTYIYISVCDVDIDNFLKITDECLPIDNFYFSKLNKTGITDKSLLYNHIKNIKTNVYFTKLLNLKKITKDLLAQIDVTLDDQKKYEDKISVENLIDFKNHIKSYILPQILLTIDDKDFEDDLFNNASMYKKKDDNLNQLLFMSDLNEDNLNSLKCFCKETFILTDKAEAYLRARDNIIESSFKGYKILI